MKYNIKTKQQNSSKGFTILELTLGAAVLSIVFLIISSTQIYMNKQLLSLSNHLEDRIDAVLGERFILKDLQIAQMSFENMSGNNFFDLIPDLPLKHLGTVGERTFTLNCTTVCGEFKFLIEDTIKGPLLIYDPISSYNIGAQTDINLSAPLTFVGLNSNGWLTSVRPEFWKQGTILLLDTASKLRPTGVGGAINLNTVPRSPIFIGYVASESDTNLSTNSTMSSLVKTTHPTTNENINTVNQFLRGIESMGGGLPLVRLRAVKVIKYFLTNTGSNKKGARLFRSEFDPIANTFKNDILLSDRIESVTFYRPSITTKMINFKITKVKD